MRPERLSFSRASHGQSSFWRSQCFWQPTQTAACSSRAGITICELDACKASSSSLQIHCRSRLTKQHRTDLNGCVKHFDTYFFSGHFWVFLDVSTSMVQCMFEGQYTRKPTYNPPSNMIWYTGDFSGAPERLLWLRPPKVTMNKFLELHEAGSILATLEPVMPEIRKTSKTTTVHKTTWLRSSQIQMKVVHRKQRKQWWILIKSANLSEAPAIH